MTYLKVFVALCLGVLVASCESEPIIIECSIKTINLVDMHYEGNSEFTVLRTINGSKIIRQSRRFASPGDCALLHTPSVVIIMYDTIAYAQSMFGGWSQLSEERFAKINSYRRGDIDIYIDTLFYFDDDSYHNTRENSEYISTAVPVFYSKEKSPIVTYSVECVIQDSLEVDGDITSFTSCHIDSLKQAGYIISLHNVNGPDMKL